MSIEFKISEAEFGVKPQVTIPDPKFLELLGEEGLRKLVSDHYELLVKSKIRHLFPIDPEDLDVAKERAADFFIQICGGYPYYRDNRGKPMMARRHQQFTIKMKDRVVWLDCYRELILALDLPESVSYSFWQYLNVFSLWMVNSK